MRWKQAGTQLCCSRSHLRAWRGWNIAPKVILSKWRRSASIGFMVDMFESRDTLFYQLAWNTRLDSEDSQLTESTNRGSTNIYIYIHTHTYYTHIHIFHKVNSNKQWYIHIYILHTYTYISQTQLNYKQAAAVLFNVLTQKVKLWSLLLKLHDVPIIVKKYSRQKYAWLFLESGDETTSHKIDISF